MALEALEAIAATAATTAAEAVVPTVLRSAAVTLPAVRLPARSAWTTGAAVATAIVPIVSIMTTMPIVSIMTVVSIVPIVTRATFVAELVMGRPRFARSHRRLCIEATVVRRLGRRSASGVGAGVHALGFLARRAFAAWTVAVTLPAFVARCAVLRSALVGARRVALLVLRSLRALIAAVAVRMAIAGVATAASRIARTTMIAVIARAAVIAMIAAIAAIEPMTATLVVGEVREARIALAIEALGARFVARRIRAIATRRLLAARIVTAGHRVATIAARLVARIADVAARGAHVRTRITRGFAIALGEQGFLAGLGARLRDRRRCGRGRRRGRRARRGGGCRFRGGLLARLGRSVAGDLLLRGGWFGGSFGRGRGFRTRGLGPGHER